MKVLIIEDEYYSFENLSAYLLKLYPKAEIAQQITNIEQMHDALMNQDDYDIIFSDIRLDDGLCFEALKDVEITRPIIFTTAYDEYALKAFQTGGISYLLKPIEQDKLKKAIEKALQLNRGGQDMNELLQFYGIQKNDSYATRLLVNSFDGSCIIQISNINHIAFEESKVMAYMNDGSHYILNDKTLDAVIFRLNPNEFFRANRQYIIHINAIKKIHTWFRQTEVVEMRGYEKIRINISKEKVSAFHNWIEQG